MAINKRIGNTPPSWANPNVVTGAVSTPGPYIGIVKNNVDPNRSGRVQVFIPDFGGKEDESSHWITIQYASPYMGATRWPSYKTKKSQLNDYKHVNHTYGMWMTPPDIGNFLLVIFVNGDIKRGYWIACVMPELTQHALPAYGGSSIIKLPEDAALSAACDAPPYPVVEFNDVNEGFKERWGEFLTIPKPIHDDIMLRLLREGLENDKVRGVISSSSQRESPSAVFGISTPGRPGPDPKDQDTQAVLNRRGGHTFIMDDGDSDGKDQVVRLRSAGGHQILMSDTEKVIYISNSAGTAWMEFTEDGKMHFYAESDVNIRTKKDFNLHSDKDINFYAANDINMYAVNKIKEQAKDISLNASVSLTEFGGKVDIASGSTLKLDAATVGSWVGSSQLVFSGGQIHLNTSPAPAAARPVNIPVVKHAETIPTQPAPIFKWKQTSTVQTTIPEAAPIPTHEPSIKLGHVSASGAAPAPGGSSGSSGGSSGSSGGSSGSSGGSSGSSGGSSGSSGSSGGSSGSSPAKVPPSAIGSGAPIKGKADESTLAAQPVSSHGVGTLTPAELTALKAQMGKSESGMNYNADNTKMVNGKPTLGYIGKYQFGATALADQGYVKPGTTLQGLNNPANWTGKDGLKSKQDFFAAHDVQEKIMDENLRRNYNTLSKLNVIDKNSPPEDVAGKLAVSHLLGAGGAKKWANGQGGSDANGTTGDTYYNKGRYATTVLAAKVNTTPPTSA